MALLSYNWLNHSPSPFAILDALIADCESHGICISLSLNCIHDCHSSFSSRLRSFL